jgi:DNA topoisomerase-2
MVYREVTFVPGFFKIIDEILVNAADHKVRRARPHASISLMLLSR